MMPSVWPWIAVNAYLAAQKTSFVLCLKPLLISHFVILFSRVGAKSGVGRDVGFNVMLQRRVQFDDPEHCSRQKASVWHFAAAGRQSLTRFARPNAVEKIGPGRNVALGLCCPSRTMQISSRRPLPAVPDDTTSSGWVYKDMIYWIVCCMACCQPLRTSSWLVV